MTIKQADKRSLMSGAKRVCLFEHGNDVKGPLMNESSFVSQPISSLPAWSKRSFFFSPAKRHFWPWSREICITATCNKHWYFFPVDRMPLRQRTRHSPRLTFEHVSCSKWTRRENENSWLHLILELWLRRAESLWFQYMELNGFESTWKMGESGGTNVLSSTRWENSRELSFEDFAGKFERKWGEKFPKG